MVKCHIPEMLSDLAFLGNPTYQWWFFNFLRISVKKQSYRDSKLKRHFGLKMEYPIPTYSKNDHSHHVQYFICFFFYKGWEKPKSPKQKSERPSVRASRGVGCSGWSTSCSWKSSLWAPVPWPTSSPFGNVPWTRLLHAVAQFLWIERGWIWLRIRYC